MYLFHPPRAMTSDADRGNDVLVVRRRHVDDSGTGRRADVLDAARYLRSIPKLVVEKDSWTPNWNLQDPRQGVINWMADPEPVTGTSVTIGMKEKESEQNCLEEN